MRIDRNLYLKRLISKMHNGKVKIITGIRRCGKSYLLRQIFKDYLLANGVKANHIIEVLLDQKEYVNTEIRTHCIIMSSAVSAIRANTTFSSMRYSCPGR